VSSDLEPQRIRISGLTKATLGEDGGMQGDGLVTSCVGEAETDPRVPVMQALRCDEFLTSLA